MTGMLRRRRSGDNMNRIALVVGIVLFLVGSLMLLASSVVLQTTVFFPLFIVCAALGIIMAAIGGEAKVTSPTFTIGGAGAIALILFGLLTNAIHSAEKRFVGSMEIRASDPTMTLRLSADASKPKTASLQFLDVVSSGSMRRLPSGYVADFSLSGDQAIDLEKEKCPLVDVGFADGHHSKKRFRQTKMIPADYSHYFEVIYILSGDDAKNRIYYSKDDESVLAGNCDDATRRELKAAVAIDQDEKISTPLTSGGKPLEDTAHSTASMPTSTASSPAGTASTPPPPPAKVIGYVVFSRLSTDFRDVKNSWFEVDSRPSARFPIANDIITATSPRSNYAEPFHYDLATKKHVVPQTTGLKVANGAKAKVGGDAIIAHDESNGAQYVISPIVELVGETIPATRDIFPPTTLPAGIKGYAYLGYLDADGSAYSDRTFDNYTRPDSLYPLPGDILVATSNVWLRAGPRRWDAGRKEYVNAATVAPIAAGKYVRVGGDTVLAKGGLSVWAPISDILESGLTDLAKQ